MRREELVAGRLEQMLSEHPGPDPARVGGLDEPITPGSPLTRRTAVRLFEAGLQSRLQDLEGRRLKDQKVGYYTIGSSGHEANAIFGHLLEPTDPAFLHYRSGAFMVARAWRGRGETPTFDTMLSFVASSEDPISGGRHKVFGSRSLAVPPQTSTIASHLPKAVGTAFGIARLARQGLASEIPANGVVYCSFGDASVNHATAQSGLTAAAAAILHRQPCPVLFVCEDNGFGISVRTPADYIQRAYSSRPGLDYYYADSRDLPATYERVQSAITHCRTTRRPVFFHLKTVRLMGHAGTDLETTYLTREQIEQNELRDPLLAYADLLLATGAIDKEQLLRMHASTKERVRRAGEEAATRPKLTSAEQVRAPLAPPDPDSLRVAVADGETRAHVFGSRLPEDDPRLRHMAFQLPLALRDLMAAYPSMCVFGEDVAKKGGVYHVTNGLHPTFGSGRVFNTILDETTILGLAQGLGQAGFLPFPEIQYLAYIHNAIDQIRGEAASLQFFSQRQFRNPMVVRVAGYGYQKGFGGHFHNDNSIGPLLDIPGLVIASPSRADDAVTMLRTCAAAAHREGSVCIFLEPIALYMEKDLHEPEDGEWQFPYPPPEEICRLGEPRVYDAAHGDELLIVSYANGLRMSLQAAAQLRRDGTRVRVLDLRWLSPLPFEAIREHARDTGRVLVVDECRASSGGPSAAILADLAQHPELRGIALRRVVSDDTFIPLGPAANLVLIQTKDVVEAAREVLA